MEMYSYPFNLIMSQCFCNFMVCPKFCYLKISVLSLFINLAFLLQGNQLMLLMSRDVAENNGSITMEYMDVTSQEGHNDCGLFAIAYAISLLYGLNSTLFKFKQEDMRWHLIHCLKNGTLVPFPVHFEGVICRAKETFFKV